MDGDLVTPYGGTLVSPRVDGDRAAELRQASRDWPSWDLTAQQLCDLELLLTGGFSPLRGFLGREDCASVCEDMRLADGTLWPIPVTLDVPADVAAELGDGRHLALRDGEGVMLASLEVREAWNPDHAAEAEHVFGTRDPHHPGVARALRPAGPVRVSGRLEGLALPAHYDFRRLRLSPAEVRDQFRRLGWRKVVAFQTRNPMHRAHVELTMRAAAAVEANLLIHPVVGMTKPGDVDHYTRVRAYQAVLDRYPRGTAALALLPLASAPGPA